MILDIFYVIFLPCIVISVVRPHVTQMIDFGLSVKDMMDDCLPLTVRVGDYALNILNIINHIFFFFFLIIPCMTTPLMRLLRVVGYTVPYP